MEAVETIQYKGCTINIYQDEGYESPNEWGDDNLFLVGYHRDFWVTRDSIITEEQAKKIFSNNYGGDYGGDMDVSDMELENKYHFFGLEAYIHSGVVLAISKEGNFPDRRWDVSQLGLVLVAKEEWKDRKVAYERAQGLIETWNDYLSGNVYGFQAETQDGEDIDSCWGYYGDYDTDRNGKDSYIVSEAKSSIDYYVKELREKHFKRLKEQIRSGVNLAYRIPLTN